MTRSIEGVSMCTNHRRRNQGGGGLTPPLFLAKLYITITSLFFKIDFLFCLLSVLISIATPPPHLHTHTFNLFIVLTLIYSTQVLLKPIETTLWSMVMYSKFERNLITQFSPHRPKSTICTSSFRRM